MKILFTVLILSSVSSLAFAVDGAVSGGGGRVVICPSTSNGAPTIRLLDLWEASAIFNRAPTLAGGNLPTDVSAALLALQDSYYTTVQSNVNGHPVSGQQYLLEYMQIRAQMFLSPNDSNVTRLHGVTLDLTSDVDELGTPTGCSPGQVVVYDPNDHIYIDQDLFDKMSEGDQAALIAHEAYYAWLRKYSSDMNSLRTRRAIGYVFSGQNFTLNLPTIPAKYIDCQSADVTEPQNHVYLWPNGTDPNTHLPVYSIYFRKVENSPLIGQTRSTFNLDVQSDAVSFFAANETCPDKYIHEWTWGFPPTGPVEFDRGLSFRFFCSNGTLFVSLIDTVPGGQGPKEIPLTCKF